MRNEQAERIWAFHTKRFMVTLDALPELYPDLSWDENGETQEKLASGEWSNFVFRVRIYLDGRVIGEDCLGNSIYADPRQFRDHIGSRGKWGSYFTDMVGSAVAEARKALAAAPRVRA